MSPHNKGCVQAHIWAAGILDNHLLVNSRVSSRQIAWWLVLPDLLTGPEMQQPSKSL